MKLGVTLADLLGVDTGKVVAEVFARLAGSDVTWVLKWRSDGSYYRREQELGNLFGRPWDWAASVADAHRFRTFENARTRRSEFSNEAPSNLIAIVRVSKPKKEISWALKVRSGSYLVREARWSVVRSKASRFGTYEAAHDERGRYREKFGDCQSMLAAEVKIVRLTKRVRRRARG